MNIIDTNGVSHIFTNNLALRQGYYLVPDVTEEVEMTELVHGRRIPNHVRELIETDEFDEVLYLFHYKDVLNSYAGRSFYNMTGLGDVSILAALYMLRDVFARQQQEQLFAVSDSVTVYTDDVDLTTEINRVFSGNNITVLPVSAIS